MMELTIIPHPAAACASSLARPIDVFERSEAIFLALEMLVRFDAVALANCVLRSRFPIGQLVRDRLLSPRFALGDWIALLECLAQLRAGEPFLPLRQWIKSSHDHSEGSLLHQFVRLRNQKAHDERRAQSTFIADVTKRAEALYTALMATHPAVPDLVLGSDGTLRLGEDGPDISGLLFRVEAVHTSAPKLLMYRGCSGGKLAWSGLDGTEASSRDDWHVLSRTLGERVISGQPLASGGSHSGALARMESTSRATIRRLSELGRYRPDQTIEREAPNLFWEAFLRRSVPLLIIEGPEGSGKSTWMSRVAEHRLASGLPILFDTAQRMGGSQPFDWGSVLGITGDAANILEGIGIESDDHRVVVAIDDVAARGPADPVLHGCLRWAETASADSALRVAIGVRSEHLRAYANDNSVALANAERYVLPPLAEPELIELAERLPIPGGCDKIRICNRRKQIAYALGRAAEAAPRRPAFAAAILESAREGEFLLPLGACDIYAKLLDVDVMGKDDSGRPLWPIRGRIVAAVARAILSRESDHVPLDAPELGSVTLVDPLSGLRRPDYIALLDGGHLVERSEEFESVVGFGNPKLFQFVAAKTCRPQEALQAMTTLLRKATTFPLLTGVAAFVISEHWGNLDPMQFAPFFIQVPQTKRVEFLLEMGAISPERYLTLVGLLASCDTSTCLDAITTQIHLAECALAGAAASRLRREPAESPEADRARYLHVRALYESDDLLGVEREVRSMKAPVDPSIHALAAEAVASRGEFQQAAEMWAAVLATVPAGQSTERGVALRGLGYVRMQQGNLAEAESLIRTAITMLMSGGNERQHSEALGELAEVLAATGRFEEARRYLADARVETERYGYLTGLGVIEGQSGLLALQEGRLDEAEEILLRSLRIHERVGNRWRRAWTYDLLARVQDAMNRTAEAAASRSRAAVLYAELAVRYN